MKCKGRPNSKPRRPSKHGAARLRYAYLDPEVEAQILKAQVRPRNNSERRSTVASLNPSVRRRMLITNHSGHRAYRMDDKTAFAVMAVTSFYGEEKYYGDNTPQLMELAEKLCREGKGRYVAQVAVWARTKGHLRSVSHALMAVVAHMCTGKPFVRPAARIIASMRGDDGTEMLAAYTCMVARPGAGFPMPWCAVFATPWDRWGHIRWPSTSPGPARGRCATPCAWSIPCPLTPRPPRPCAPAWRGP